MFELPRGLDPLPLPPNDEILLPDDDIPPPVQKPKAKRKRKEIKFLTEEELARLFSAIHSVRDRAIFQLAYRAGLRASEVGLLQLRDYDPKSDRIFIHRLGVERVQDWIGHANIQSTMEYAKVTNA